jgi:hypothetical protein
MEATLRGDLGLAMLLAAAIAVDVRPNDRHVFYPQISRVSSAQRRLIYWKCACVYFATAIKFGVADSHVLYTNDEKPVQVGGIDIRDFLSNKLKVKIVHLDFKRFKTPIQLCRTFRNSYYKFEVLEHICQQECNYAILADVDCIWLRPLPLLNVENSIRELYLVPIRDRAVDPKDIHDVFKTIDAQYFERLPQWFGGEFIAAKPKVLTRLRSDLESKYDAILERDDINSLRIGPGNVLENDEWLLSLIANGRNYSVRDASAFFRRVWTFGPSSPSNLDLSGLHLPAEKNIGFRTIFDDVLNDASVFWTSPLYDVRSYLGECVGIPERLRWPSYSRVEMVARWLSRNSQKWGLVGRGHSYVSRWARRILSINS